jgi:acyl-CoA thioesterase-1
VCAWVVLFACAAVAAAQDKADPKPAAKPPAAAKAPNPAFAKVEDDPKLPRVLLIGDSISIGYTPAVRELLKGKANVHRIPTNGGPTSNGVKNLDAWLGDGKWDVIHLNFGLHDLKVMKDEKHQVPSEEYKRNLETIVDRLLKTGAKVIWATTTPVPEGPLNPVRRFGDVATYNDIAATVMAGRTVAIDELNAAITPRLKELQNPKDVHFTAGGYKLLAGEVARSIEAALN